MKFYVNDRLRRAEKRVHVFARKPFFALYKYRKRWLRRKSEYQIQPCRAVKTLVQNELQPVQSFKYDWIRIQFQQSNPICPPECPRAIWKGCRSSVIDALHCSQIYSPSLFANILINGTPIKLDTFVTGGVLSEWNHQCNGWNCINWWLVPYNHIVEQNILSCNETMTIGVISCHKLRYNYCWSYGALTKRS